MLFNKARMLELIASHNMGIDVEGFERAYKEVEKELGSDASEFEIVEEACNRLGLN